MKKRRKYILITVIVLMALGPFSYDEMVELILFRDRRLQYLRVQPETKSEAIAS